MELVRKNVPKTPFINQHHYYSHSHLQCVFIITSTCALAVICQRATPPVPRCGAIAKCPPLQETSL